MKDKNQALRDWLDELIGQPVQVEWNADVQMFGVIADDDIIGAGTTEEDALENARETVRRWGPT